MQKKTSIFRTEKYPATSLFQNHPDEVHGIFDMHCSENKDYVWGLVVNSKHLDRSNDVVTKYIAKHEPGNLKYYVKNMKNKSELILNISDGVSINIKHGTHELYGLFGLLQDLCSSMSSPHLFVLFRKYWLFSLLAAGMIIPTFSGRRVVVSRLGYRWWRDRSTDHYNFTRYLGLGRLYLANKNTLR